MPEGGTLTVTAENVALPVVEAERHNVPPGNFVCVSVVDTGSGIPRDVMEKMFKPFFTTKGDKGTGLGLSTCQNIVKTHGGFITVQSKVGAGTRFEVYLPASTGRTPDTSMIARNPLPSGKGERILVVDDEEAILAITRAALENFGYKVVTANSGTEAVNFFAQNHADINLLITDLGMPLMDGPSAVAAMRKIQPDLKVILMSGSEGGTPEKMASKVTMDAFISKPFTNEKLLETVHEVLVKK